MSIQGNNINSASIIQKEIFLIDVAAGAEVKRLSAPGSGGTTQNTVIHNYGIGSPALDHNMIHFSGTARRRRQSITTLYQPKCLLKNSEKEVITKRAILFTSGLVLVSNGLCPRLHISYMSTPKLHTSLDVEYFL